MIYEDIFNLYSESYDNHIQAEKDYEESVAKKWFSILPSLSAKSQIYKKLSEDLKIIIANNFREEILNHITLAEIEHEIQQKMCRTLVETYGSELAGDYNKSEILAYTNLVKITKLLDYGK